MSKQGFRLQVATVSNDRRSTVVFGDPDCIADPCSLHGTCHCMCPCAPDEPPGVNCPACKEQFGE